jgi:hypothetical protein
MAPKRTPFSYILGNGSRLPRLLKVARVLLCALGVYALLLDNAWWWRSAAEPTIEVCTPVSEEALTLYTDIVSYRMRSPDMALLVVIVDVTDALSPKVALCPRPYETYRLDLPTLRLRVAQAPEEAVASLLAHVAGTTPPTKVHVCGSSENNATAWLRLKLRYRETAAAGHARASTGSKARRHATLGDVCIDDATFLGLFSSPDRTPGNAEALFAYVVAMRGASRPHAGGPCFFVPLLPHPPRCKTTPCLAVLSEQDEILNAARRWLTRVHFNP